MNYELFCRKTKQKNKNPDPFLLVGSNSSMGRQFILLDIQFSRISAVHVIDHLISNKRWN